MDFVCQKLTEWELDELVQTFHDNGIDKETFFLLDSVTCKELIPRLGPRLKFLKELQKLKCETNDPETPLENHLLNTSNISTSSTITVTSDVDDQEIFFNEALQNDILIFEDSPQSSQQSQVFKRPFLPEPEEQQANKLAKHSIFPRGLEELLKSSPDGRIVLKRKHNFNNDCRQKLVKVIIDHLLQIHSRLTPLSLAAAADEIVHLFPQEIKEAYYIPYMKKPGSSLKLLPQGKLYSRYINIRKTLRNADGCTSTSEDFDVQICQENPVSTEEQQAAYAALQFVTTDNVTEAFSQWNDTFDLRMKKRKECASAQEYFNAFPLLQLPDGYKLILQDFYVKYPKTESIYQVWPDIAIAVLDLAIKSDVKVPELKELNANKLALSLKVLPWLFTPTTVRNLQKKSNWRPSRLEVQDSFFLHIQTPGELHQKIEERTAILFGRNSNLQPFFVAVGPLSNIEAFYVVVDKQLYKLENALTALDITFKIFFCLDLEYPAECRAVWQVINALVYKIQDDTGLSSSASIVLAEIQGKLADKSN